MDKKTLVKTLSDKTGLAEKECLLVLDAHNETIIESLSRREDVKLVGFGLYTTHLSKGRMGRNPKTGEPVQINDKVVAKFRAGKSLKDSVHNNNIVA